MKIIVMVILAVGFTACLLFFANPPAKANTETQKALIVLSHAKTFDDGVAGERPGDGQSPLYVAYHKLVVADKPVQTDVLKSMQKRSTSAGKLYFAALIRELDSPAGIVALKELMNDSTKVSYVSGCESVSYPVSEIAKKLLQEGKFINFCLRYRCKT